MHLVRDALPEAADRTDRPRLTAASPTLVVSLGSSICGDDGVGPLVLSLLRAFGVPPGVRLERVGDPLLLLEIWREDDNVVLVDAAQTNDAAPGTCLTVDALTAEVPQGIHPLSSHGIGFAETLSLARHLDRLPESLTVHAIVGSAWGQGEAMTEPVIKAAERLAKQLHDALAPVPRAA